MRLCECESVNVEDCENTKVANACDTPSYQLQLFSNRSEIDVRIFVQKNKGYKLIVLIKYAKSMRREDLALHD